MGQKLTDPRLVTKLLAIMETKVHSITAEMLP
jgi:hypothetical protein